MNFNQSGIVIIIGNNDAGKTTLSQFLAGCENEITSINLINIIDMIHNNFSLKIIDMPCLSTIENNRKILISLESILKENTRFPVLACLFCVKADLRISSESFQFFVEYYYNSFGNLFDRNLIIMLTSDKLIESKILSKIKNNVYNFFGEIVSTCEPLIFYLNSLEKNNNIRLILLHIIINFDSMTLSDIKLIKSKTSTEDEIKLIEMEQYIGNIKSVNFIIIKPYLLDILIQKLQLELKLKSIENKLIECKKFKSILFSYETVQPECISNSLIYSKEFNITDVKMVNKFNIDINLIYLNDKTIQLNIVDYNANTSFVVLKFYTNNRYYHEHNLIRLTKNKNIYIEKLKEINDVINEFMKICEPEIRRNMVYFNSLFDEEYKNKRNEKYISLSDYVQGLKD